LAISKYSCLNYLKDEPEKKFLVAFTYFGQSIYVVTDI
jgi:hypothetical protein